MDKKEISNGWIIFWFIIFWPVGVYLLVTRDSSGFSNGKGFIFWGWFLIVIDIFAIIGWFSEGIQIEDFIIAILLGGAGFFLIKTGKKKKQRYIRLNNYINYITYQQTYSLDNMAALENTTFEAVVEDLTFLYNKGHIRNNTYIDVANRVIVDRAPVTYNTPQPVNEVRNVPSTKTVRCSGCGANNVAVVGTVTTCEYCGTPINA